MRFLVSLAVVCLFSFLSPLRTEAQPLTVEAIAGCPDITVTPGLTIGEINIYIDWDINNPGSKIFDIHMNIGSPTGWNMEVQWAADTLTKQKAVLRKDLQNGETIGAILIAKSELEGSNHTLAEMGEILINNNDPNFISFVPLVILMENPLDGEKYTIAVTLNDGKLLCLTQQLGLVSTPFGPELLILDTLSSVELLLESNSIKDSQVIGLQASVIDLLNQNNALNQSLGECSEATVSLDVALNAEKQKVLACEEASTESQAALSESTSALVEAKDEASKMQKLVNRNKKSAKGQKWFKSLRKRLKNLQAKLSQSS